MDTQNRKLFQIFTMLPSLYIICLVPKMANAVVLWVIVYFCVTSVNTKDFNSISKCYIFQCDRDSLVFPFNGNSIFGSFHLNISKPLCTLLGYPQ